MTVFSTKGHAVVHVLGNLGERGDVYNDNAEGRETLAGADDLSGGVIEQHLLCALRVHALEGLQ